MPPRRRRDVPAATPPRRPRRDAPAATPRRRRRDAPAATPPRRRRDDAATTPRRRRVSRPVASNQRKAAFGPRTRAAASIPRSRPVARTSFLQQTIATGTAFDAAVMVKSTFPEHDASPSHTTSAPSVLSSRTSRRNVSSLPASFPIRVVTWMPAWLTYLGARARSKTGRGGVAAASRRAVPTRAVRGDGSRRRRGRDADIPWGKIAAAPRPRRG